MKANPNEVEAKLEEIVQAWLKQPYPGGDLQQAHQAAKISQIYLMKALLVATNYDETLTARIEDLWNNYVTGVARDEQNAALKAHLLTSTTFHTVWPFLGMNPSAEK